MSDLERLEAVFPAATPVATNGHAPHPVGGVTADYALKLRRLGARWRAVLDTVGAAEGYASASETDMALIDALVKRNFTDGEIWETLRSSPRYQDRVQRKGERHTERLYLTEIAKARATVTPFPPDPQPARGSGGRHSRSQRSGSFRRHAAAGVSSGAPAPAHAPTLAFPPAPEPEPAPAPFALVTPADSFISRYVSYAAKRTDAPPEAHELMAVGALSALAGPIVRLPIATSVHGWRLVLWCCYIVDSTVGRKSTVIGLIEDIVGPVLGDHAFLRWEGSPQGFIQRLQERDGQPAVFLRDEYSGLIQQMNRGGHMGGMAQMLIRAYDGGVIENVRVRKKNADGELERDIDRASDPYLVTIAASTYTSFIERATIDNVLDGFLARFIFVTGTATPRRLPKLTRELLDERDQLRRQAQGFVERAIEMPEPVVPDAVLDAAWEIEQAWLLEANASDHPDALAASYKRLSESVLKVAALLAIDEGDAPLVRLDHYETALRIAARWQRSTRELVERLGATEFLRHCTAVRATIQRHPGIALSQLYRHHRKLRKRDFDEVLDALLDQEEIQQLDEAPQAGEAGRPATRFYPLAASEATP